MPLPCCLKDLRFISGACIWESCWPKSYSTELEQNVDVLRYSLQPKQRFRSMLKNII